MNTLKKFFAIALVLTVGTLLVHAQGKGGGKSPSEKATKVTERLTSELGLSLQQSNQVKGILLNLFSETKSLRESGEVDRSEMKALRESANSKLESVLSTSQYEQYLAMKAERKGNRKGGRDGQVKWEERLDLLRTELNLTVSQETQLTAIFKEHKPGIKAAKSSGDREQMKVLKKELRADVKSVLTPAQLERFKELRDEKRGERGGKGKRGSRG